MLDILSAIDRMEPLPKEAIKVIVIFISHPVADIIKPQINEEGGFNVIRLAYQNCEYHVSRHTEDELSRQSWDRTVIETTLKYKLQIRYLTSDALHRLDPSFVHLNKEVIEEILFWRV